MNRLASHDNVFVTLVCLNLLFPHNLWIYSIVYVWFIPVEQRTPISVTNANIKMIQFYFFLYFFIHIHCPLSRRSKTKRKSNEKMSNLKCRSGVTTLSWTIACFYNENSRNNGDRWVIQWDCEWQTHTRSLHIRLTTISHEAKENENWNEIKTPTAFKYCALRIVKIRKWMKHEPCVTSICRPKYNERRRKKWNFFLIFSLFHRIRAYVNSKDNATRNIIRMI